MKNYIKEIAITLIIVLSSFLVSINSETSKNEVVVRATSDEVLPKSEFTNLIEQHPKKETKEVHFKLDSLLKRINKRHDFHGSILVAKNGKIVYNNQIGYADFRKKEPINEASMFQLASVSKQFTAAAIMLLNERNQIQLTDTVNSYFPDFPYENVTIKNLLNHTAG